MKNSLRFLLKLTLVYFLSLIAGLWITRYGMDTWDSLSHVRQGRWLLEKYFPFLSQWIQSQAHDPPVDPTLKWYGALWEVWISFFGEIVFAFLRDPHWVRLAANFALLPTTLFSLYLFWRAESASRWGAAFVAVFPLLHIRWVGHSLINTKDFSFACFYVLSFLTLWKLAHTRNSPSLWRGTFAALVPYFVRPPFTLHFVAWLGFIFFRTKNYRKPLQVLGLSIALIYLFTPGIWPFNFRAWIDSFSLFSKFPWEGTVWVLGKEYLASQAPFWYPLHWFLVSLHPLGFLGILFSLGFAVFRFHRLSSVTRYFGGFILVSWVVIVLKKPTFYDEDRHILFLYFSLMVWSAMVVSHAIDLNKSKFKNFNVTVTLALVSLLASGVSLYEWGRFTYVYKSGLSGSKKAHDYSGDYWGVCLPVALNALVQKIPPRSTVWVWAPESVVLSQYMRLRFSRFPVVRGTLSIRAVRPTPDSKPQRGDWIIAFNRYREGDRLVREESAGNFRIHEKIAMPFEPQACVVGEVLNPAAFVQ